ncbi:MAG: HupE/UreJ family protein [Rhodobacteraceae bacterium]|nr:HupE/UreJ family protein [Paracoccaceae bacterium]
MASRIHSVVLANVLACVLALWSSLVAAHELRPAIGDLTVNDGQIRLVLRLNAEAIVAGVDLNGIADTDAAEQAEEVDRLRNLPEAEIEQALLRGLPEVLGKLRLMAGATPVALDGLEIIAEPVANIELPRETRLVLGGTLPAGETTLELLWPAEFGVLILRQQGVEDPYTGYLAGGVSTGPIDVSGGQAMTLLGAFLTYIPVGFDHILPLGLDHILFVLGLFLLAPNLGALVWQVSAFTLAHTVTLALGATGVVTVPAHIVEPLIAASIVYVAVENLFTTRLSRWRPAVIFGFGLLHGLGFASVLGDFGLPQGQFISALIGFNIGVELGQLTVIAVAFLISFAVLRRTDQAEPNVFKGMIYLIVAVVILPVALIPLAAQSAQTFEAGLPLLVALAILAGLCANAMVVGGQGAYRKMVALPSSILIALVGAFWVVERVFF